MVEIDLSNIYNWKCYSKCLITILNKHQSIITDSSYVQLVWLNLELMHISFAFHNRINTEIEIYGNTDEEEVEVAMKVYKVEMTCN